MLRMSAGREDDEHTKRGQMTDMSEEKQFKNYQEIMEDIAKERVAAANERGWTNSDEEWLNGTIKKQADVIDKQEAEIKRLRSEMEMLRTALDRALGPKQEETSNYGRVMWFGSDD